MLNWETNKETLDSAVQGLCLPSKLGQRHAGIDIHRVNSNKMPLWKP